MDVPKAFENMTREEILSEIDRVIDVMYSHLNKISRELDKCNSEDKIKSLNLNVGDISKCLTYLQSARICIVSVGGLEEGC